MEFIDLLTILIAMVVLLFAILVLFRLKDRDDFHDRVTMLMQHRNSLLDEVDYKRAYQRDELDQMSGLKKIFFQLQVQGDEGKKKLRLSLVRAGWMSPKAIYFYVAWKFGAVILGAVGAAVYAFMFSHWPLMIKIACVIGGALLGSYGVDTVISQAQKRRRVRIANSFPDALDLLVICTEAGLSLQMAVQRVAREMGQLSSDLGYEFGLLSIEMNILPDMRTALENFATRLDASIYQSMVSTLVQSEQYGTPIAQTMRVVSDEFRQDRLMRAEERAGKLPVLLTLPMVLFIFPTIFIVVLGPALIRIYEAFHKAG